MYPICNSLKDVIDPGHREASHISPGEDDADDRGRGEEEMELDEGDDLAHGPVQAPEGGPQ